MNTQSIVTGHDDQGCSCVIYAGPLLGNESFTYQPGFSAAIFGQTSAEPMVGSNVTSRLLPITNVLPCVAGTTALMVTFPPVLAEEAQKNIAPEDIANELEERLPGFAQVFDPDAPGFHRTDTIDYAVLIAGELTLLLDNGESAHLKAGDVIVQNGTRHAWLNTSNSPARMMFVMVGATRV
ncbi:MAG: cupin domain-containing protein [Atribacterota bacterium]|nr:cupin domain-containing protein [Atribacterota bacterium]